MASPTFTQASYESTLNGAIDSTTGSKTVEVSLPLKVFAAEDVAVINLGSDNEEWFEITNLDSAASTITFGKRGLDLENTGTLNEVAANRKAHSPGELIAVVTFPNKIHSQNTDTGTTSTTFDINSGGNKATLDSTGLTSNQVFTFPDGSGEIITDDETQPIANKTINSSTLNSPVIDGTLSGTAFETPLGSPGATDKVVSAFDIRAAITASVAGVASVDGLTGAVTTSVDSTLTKTIVSNDIEFKIDTDQQYLFNQIFA